VTATPLKTHQSAAGREEALHPRKGRLRRELSSFAVLLLTLSSLSPVVSVFGIGGDVLHQAGAGAATLFGLAILAALIWAVVYAELGSAYPYAGGDYVGVGRVLGGWAGCVTLALWASSAGPAVAFAAETLAPYVAQFAPGVPAPLVIFGGLAGALGVALLSVRRGAVVTGLFLAVETLALLILTVVGAGRPARGLDAILIHPVTLNASGALAPVALSVLGVAAISAVYGTVGGNQAINFGEELHDPHRRMGRVILLACVIGAFSTALPVIFVVMSAPDLHALLQSPAPFAQFLSSSLGHWAGPALSAGVALAIFNANIVAIMGMARIYFSLGRDRLFPGAINRLLSGVDVHSGTPRAATLVVGAYSAACCFVPAHALLVFSSGLLVYGWSLVCLAVLIGRSKGLTGAKGYWRSPLFPLAPVTGLGMALAFAIADLLDPGAGRPSLLLLGLVVAVALAWYQFVLRPRGWTPQLGEGADSEVAMAEPNGGPDEAGARDRGPLC
jgi:amino acid transporter